MRRCVLLLLVASAVGFAPAPLPRAERHTRPDGFREIEGHWISGGSKLHITPGRFTHSADCYYEMKIDTSKRPFEFDLRGLGSSCVGRDFTGIYKVEGDKLILSYDSGRLNRPTSFDGPGAGYVQVYKRVSR